MNNNYTPTTNPADLAAAYAKQHNLNPVAARALAPLTKYLDGEKYSEIIINRPGEIMLETHEGDWETHPEPTLTLPALEEVARTIANMANQLFTPGNPIMTCKMPGGHRVQVVAGYHAPQGFNMAIRLKKERNYKFEEFDLPAADRAAVVDAVKNRKTILISGGTGTGKTSFLNAILPFIPMDERLVTLEDVPELKVPHRNWAQMVFASDDTGLGAQNITDVLNACLRMRPDRIILGEIRKENAFTFCSAINTGHNGSMATIHANNPKAAIDAVLNRVLLNGDALESTMNILRRQLLDDLQGVVQLTRHKAHVTGYFREIRNGEIITPGV
jgi:type IV secretion system protein VirB11